ncbi:DDE_3 domain-containing protein [Trichonephila clavipes]|nr:DDE_3 domain-containing protein [Trichonephila clavipes]
MRQISIKVDKCKFYKTKEYGGGSVMICVVAGPIVILKGMMTREKYREILDDQVHPMMRTLFPAGYGIFRDDNAPGLVQLGFDEHEEEVENLP